MAAERVLGINGMGRIGKLTLWYHLGRSEFGRIVINAGRPVGKSLDSVVQYLTKDSTYGPLHRFLHGYGARSDVRVADESRGVISAFGKEVVILREARNPQNVAWRDHGVSVVVECTGKFRDPNAEHDAAGGALRGHLAAGVRVVVQSSPFKFRQDSSMPADAAMLIQGINHYRFDPGVHRIVSAASCTTTALAHMMRPLLDRDLTRHMITAGMSTVHAATNTQPVLDAVPGGGASDLRKTRAALNNIVLTSTNAAGALEHVMPEIARIGFMADSVRIPTSSVSLIILNVTFQSEAMADGTLPLNRESINGIYRQAAGCEARGLLKYTDEQNVSADMLGEDAAVVIEGAETHTRTGFVEIALPAETTGVPHQSVRVPLTHVKVFGWYDNEMGSYTCRLGQLTEHIARALD